MSKDRKVEDYVEPEYITVVVSDPQTVNDERGEPQYTTYLVATDVIYYFSIAFSQNFRQPSPNILQKSSLSVDDIMTLFG